LKYIDNLKIEILANDIGKDEYIEKFIDSTYAFFLQNKINPNEFKPFYEYIKKNYVCDRVELHKVLRLKFGTEASTFVDVWIEQKEKKDRQAANKEEKIEQKIQEFSPENVVQLLALKQKEKARLEEEKLKKEIAKLKAETSKSIIGKMKRASKSPEAKKTKKALKGIWSGIQKAYGYK